MAEDEVRIDRFQTEDVVLADTPRTPAIADDLLLDLGVYWMPRYIQRNEVAGWLSRNKPSDLLLADLEDNDLLYVEELEFSREPKAGDRFTGAPGHDGIRVRSVES